MEKQKVLDLLMSQIVNLQIKGLNTHPSPQSATEQGSMAVAENCVIDRENSIEPRRGYEKIIPTPVGTKAEELYFFRDDIWAYLSDDTIRNTTTGASWSTKASQVNHPDRIIYGRVKATKANNNMYFATNGSTMSTGILKIQTNDLAAVTAGILKPSAPYIWTNVSLGTTWENIGVRAVVSRADANNNLIISEPSDLTIINYSSSATAGSYIEVALFIADYTKSNYTYGLGDTVEFYISKSATYTGTTDPDLYPPSDEMFSYGSQKISANDIARGYVLYRLNIPTSTNALTASKTLYTSATQEGAGQGNLVPRASTDITTWKGYTFYAGMKEPATVEMKTNGTAFSGETIEINQSERYVSIARQLDNPDFQVSTGWTLGSGWAIATGSGGTLAKTGANTNTASQSLKKVFSGAAVTAFIDVTVGSSGTGFTVSAGSTTLGTILAAGKYALSGIATGTGAFTITPLSNSSTITIGTIYVAVEAVNSIFAGFGEDYYSSATSELTKFFSAKEVKNYQINSFARVVQANALSGFTVANTRTLADNNMNQFFIYSRVDGISSYYVRAAGIYPINTTDNPVNTTDNTITVLTGHRWYTGYRVRLWDNVEGTIPFSGTCPSPLSAGTDYYVIWNSNTKIKLATSEANAFAGTAIDLTTTGGGFYLGNVNTFVNYYTSESDTSSKKNQSVQNTTYSTLNFSKYLQPEHCPINNYFDVGDSSARIIRILPLRESLIILKEDGVYRLTGYNPASFAVDTLDSTLNIFSADSACVLNNKVFVLTNQGICAISDTGSQIISRPIENEILKLTRAGQVYCQMTKGIAYETDRKYILYVTSTEDTSKYNTNFTMAFVYNYMTNTWTTWKYSGITAAVAQGSSLYSNNDKIFYQHATEEFILIEKKTNSHLDYYEDYVSTTLYFGATGSTHVYLASYSPFYLEITYHIPSQTPTWTGADSINIYDPTTHTIKESNIPIDSIDTVNRKIYLDSAPLGSLSEYDIITLNTFTRFDPSATIPLTSVSGISVGDAAISVGTDYDPKLVIAVDTVAKTVTLREPILVNLPDSYTFGKAIPVNIVFNPINCESPMNLKVFREMGLIFGMPYFGYNGSVTSYHNSYATFLNNTSKYDDALALSPNIWGTQTYGGFTSKITDSTNSLMMNYNFRVYVPRSRQVCTHISPRIYIKEACSYWRLNGISLSYNNINDRTVK